ncbi:MAG: hypothetical protein ACK5NF_05715 [Bacilli bacterium]
MNPKIDNDANFGYTNNTKREHLFTRLCRKTSILHKCNRPRITWHKHNCTVLKDKQNIRKNQRDYGKRFYSKLKFYPLNDLNLQMKAY